MQFMKEQGMGAAARLPADVPADADLDRAVAARCRRTFELRQAPFLWGFTWIKDLAKPDYLIHFGHSVPIPILGSSGRTPGTSTGSTSCRSCWRSCSTCSRSSSPSPPAVTPEQQQQQKMMQWMTLLFPLFLYSGPSGLNLYILTSTTIGIIESKIIRDHIKQREEAEKAGR